MVGIIVILHHSVAYVGSMSFEIIKKKYTDVYKPVTLVSFYNYSNGRRYSDSIYSQCRIAIVLMSKIVNKMPCNYYLNKFYFMHVSAIGDAIS